MTKEEKDAQFTAFQHAMQELKAIRAKQERLEARVDWLEKRTGPITEYVPPTKWDS